MKKHLHIQKLLLGHIVPNAIRARFRNLTIYIWIPGLFFLAACGMDSRSVPPFEIDFFPLAANANIEFDVRIVEKKSYSVWINFYFDESNRDVAERTYVLLGVPLTYLETEGAKRPGVPAAFEVKVRRSDADKPFFVDEIDHPESGARLGGRYADLTSVILEPGQYKVNVKVLSASPELSTIRTTTDLSQTDDPK